MKQLQNEGEPFRVWKKTEPERFSHFFLATGTKYRYDKKSR